MPRFVLLRHECPPDCEKPSHWDFMLEVDDVLWTWELRELPSVWLIALGMEVAGDSPTVSATRLADHRLAYLDYEGPVSGDRGSVSRVDGGTYEFVERTSKRTAIVLQGVKLKGAIVLRHVSETWVLG
jgi:DNA polymerase Ligase (LigD)